MQVLPQLLLIAGSALCGGHAARSKVSLSSVDSRASGASLQTACEECDSCAYHGQQVLPHFARTRNKNACHLSRHTLLKSHGWWCVAAEVPKGCSCEGTPRQLSVYHGYEWVPCGEGTGFMTRMIDQMSELKGNIVKTPVLLADASDFKDEYEAEISLFAERSQEPEEHVIEMAPLYETIVGELKLAHIYKERDFQTQVARARLREEQGVVQVVKDLLRAETDATTAEHYHAAAAPGDRTSLLEAMDVCRYNLQSYYGRTDGKRGPRELIESRDPCQHINFRRSGITKVEKELETEGLNETLAFTLQQQLKLLHVCFERGNNLDVLLDLLAQHGLLTQPPRTTKGAVQFIETILNGKDQYRSESKFGRSLRQFDAHPSSRRVLGMCSYFVRRARLPAA